MSIPAIVWIAVATIVFMFAAFAINTPTSGLYETFVKVILTVLWFSGLSLLTAAFISTIALPAGVRWY